jgi:hypothetical protein
MANIAVGVTVAKLFIEPRSTLLNKLFKKAQGSHLGSAK